MALRAYLRRPSGWVCACSAASTCPRFKRTARPTRKAFSLSALIHSYTVCGRIPNRSAACGTVKIWSLRSASAAALACSASNNSYSSRAARRECRSISANRGVKTIAQSMGGLSAGGMVRFALIMFARLDFMLVASKVRQVITHQKTYPSFPMYYPVLSYYPVN